MTKKEMTVMIAEKTKLSQKGVASVISELTELIVDTVVKEKELRLDGLGTFTVTTRSARKGRNLQTGEEIEIPACNIVKFKAAKAFKDAVN